MVCGRLWSREDGLTEMTALSGDLRRRDMAMVPQSWKLQVARGKSVWMMGEQDIEIVRMPGQRLAGDSVV